jgi:hypothetical protein
MASSLLDKFGVERPPEQADSFRVSDGTAERVVRFNLGLFDRFMSGKLPASWRSWTEPKQALPIDQEVTRLIQRNAKPRIVRSGHATACPYALARGAVGIGLVHAAMAASGAMLSDGPISVRQVAAAASDLKHPQRALLMLRSLYAGVQQLTNFPATYRHHEAAPDIAADVTRLRRVDIALLQLIIDLPEIAALADREHRRLTQYQGNAWKLAFATALGHCWLELTGDEPSSSSTGRFVPFVEAAWRSIKVPPPQDEKWERAIRTVCDRHRGKWHPAPRRRRAPRDESPGARSEGVRHSSKA